MRSSSAKAATIVASLSVADKIRLLSGHDFWTTEAIPEADVPSIMLTDGPHGLRKQAGTSDHVDVGASVPATCFPTAAALGSTWDPVLLEEVGHALGRESAAENVAALLGPGLNIKRHPAGGRAFEYFSEDPVVSGKMAAGLVRGIQAEGVGACLKHFAVNNQETRRMTIDTIVDERTLHELYLTGFEIAVRESSPWTVMCAYNKINGVHCDVIPGLLTGALRNEWGFDGLVMTDWLATSDRPAAIRAGLDLEMPGSDGTWNPAIDDAMRIGLLTTEDLDRAATRVVNLALRATRPGSDRTPPDFDAHHALARRAAAAGSVLLKNDGLLPLPATGTIAVIGAFATHPRYQGGGSSLVTPTRLDVMLDAMREQAGANRITYAPGYDPITGDTTPEQLDEAIRVATAADAIVLVVGLPSRMESEGFDRENLRLPVAHDRLVNEIVHVHPRVAVVLMNGGSLELPWANLPAAILEAYLGGQAGGSAIADVLLGAAEPGGRLAESFPVRATDLPSSRNFPGAPNQVEYREGLYVGYRYHDASGVAARFPFGHGLGYTTFSFGKATAKKVGEGYEVSAKVTNTGARTGSEVVQVYVRDVESTLYRPPKELKGFAKVRLAPGKSATVKIPLDRRAFAVYDAATRAWVVEAGEFEILVGASSTDIRSTVKVTVASKDKLTARPGAAPSRFVATDAEFTAMLGRTIPTPRPRLPFHRDSTVADLGQTLAGAIPRAVIGVMVRKQFRGENDPDVAASNKAFIENMPLRGVAMASAGHMPLTRIDKIIGRLNALSLKARRARR